MITLFATVLALSFEGLLLTRLALGAVAGTAGPAIASLTGDYFGADERGGIWSYILVGEAAGTAFGFIISGFAASLIGWQAAFVILAIPGFLLARQLWRTVPEPLRGGQSHLGVGATDLDLAVIEGAARTERGGRPAAEEPPASAPQHEAARQAAQRAGAAQDDRLVLREDPRRMSTVRSLRYIFAVRSNTLMIVGSSLGYFYFTGLQTFALLFVKGRYHASQATAELALALLVGGAAIGTIAGGRLSDVLLRRGIIAARLWLPGVCYVSAAALLIPAFVGSTLGGAVWFAVAGTALISAANPPIQAARLDVMPAGLWGRSASALTLVRSLAQAAAPVAFGGVSSLAAGIVPTQAPIGTHPRAPSSSATIGLEVSFLIMLASLLAAGLLLLRARHLRH